MRDYRNEDELRRDDARDTSFFRGSRRKRLPALNFGSNRTGGGEETATPDKTPSKKEAAPAVNKRNAKIEEETSSYSAPLSRFAAFDEARSERAIHLSDATADFNTAVENRSFADRFALTQALRIWIAVAWGVAAIVLAGEIGAVKAAGEFNNSANALTNTVSNTVWGGSLADASRLQLALSALAFAGGLAAFASLLFASLRGGFSNGPITTEASRLGGALATQLKDSASMMAQHHDRAEAYLAGGDAMTLTKNIKAAFENDDKASVQNVQTFLNGLAPSKSGASQRTSHADTFLSGLAGLAVGVTIGAGSVFYATGKTASLSTGGLALLGFWAIVGGAVLYVVADRIAAPLATALFAGEERRRLNNAGADIRAALDGAPTHDAIAQQLEALSRNQPTAPRSPDRDVMQPHSGASFQADIEATQYRAAPSSQSGPLDWRERQDANPRFVDTGFQAAPEQWLAEEKKSKPGKFFKR